MYEVYFKSDAEDSKKIILVKDGFSLVAAIFNIFWAIYKGMWIVFLIGIIFNTIVLKFSHSPILSNFGPVLQIGLFLFFGFFAKELLTNHLENKGYRLCDVVFANSDLEGEYKFYKKNPNFLLNKKV